MALSLLEDRNLFAVVGAVTVLILVWMAWFRYWHIGFGVDLFYKNEDGTVWTGSVLINSPAGEAGVPRRTRVVSINGTPLTFSSVEEFRSWFRTYRPTLYRSDRWLLELPHGEYLELSLEPELIITKIPVYWDPNSVDPDPPRSRHTRTCVRECPKTGEIITWQTPTDDAIRRIVE